MEEYIHDFLNYESRIKNVGLYDRASTSPQMTNYARPGNMDILTNYAKKMNWRIIASGCDSCCGEDFDEYNRPILYALMRCERVDTIIVYSFDRLARSDKSAAAIKAMAHALKKNLVIVDNQEMSRINDEFCNLVLEAAKVYIEEKQKQLEGINQ